VNKRTRVLMAIAGLSALWALWAATRPPEVTPVAKARPRPAGNRLVSRGPADDGQERVLATRAPLAEGAGADPFTAPAPVLPRVKAPPPPPPAPPPVVAVEVVQPTPPPPPPPPKPTLPYRYVGMLAERDGSDARVFLMLGDKMLMARRGDALEGGWRLDTISSRELQFVRPSDNATLKLSVEEGV
jgi:hypothetical protein